MASAAATYLETATDSREYDILERAAQKAPQGHLSCEIGLRRGGASYKIMRTMQPAAHIAIDPYGNIDYVDWETSRRKLDYTNQMKNESLAHLYQWAFENDINFVFFQLEDTEFFQRFPDGVPIYSEEKQIRKDFSLVFFDGPHSSAAIKAEIEYFADKTVTGGFWVFDDINQYPHMENVHEFILQYGFELFEKGDCKISYLKV